MSYIIIDDRIEKYESYIVFFSMKDCRNEECLSRWKIDTKGGWGVAPTDHVCTQRLAGRGECGWSEGAPGQCPIRLPFILFYIQSSIVL